MVEAKVGANRDGHFLRLPDCKLGRAYGGCNAVGIAITFDVRVLSPAVFVVALCSVGAHFRDHRGEASGGAVVERPAAILVRHVVELAHGGRQWLQDCVGGGDGDALPADEREVER